jgi:hypothetical protein
LGEALPRRPRSLSDNLPRPGDLLEHRNQPLTVPYTSEALRQDLERVRNAWDECQANRDRDAIYGYLNAVYGLVAWWVAEGREIDRARRALRLGRLDVSEREDPFAAVIRCTADPAKADKRTRSKWSRVMRYAAAYKPDSEPWTSSSSAGVASTRAPLGPRAHQRARYALREDPGGISHWGLKDFLSGDCRGRSRCRLGLKSP